MQKYKEELFGSSTDVYPTDYYAILDMIKDRGLTLEQFEAMNVENQAMTIAHYRLSGMIDVLRRHDELQKEKSKNLGKKGRK